jgi:hypothetical protein
MLRGAFALAPTVAIVGCQPPVSEAAAARVEIECIAAA